METNDSMTFFRAASFSLLSFGVALIPSNTSLWFDFANAIVILASSHRTLACKNVVPITTADYPTAARRPAYSVLDTSRLRALGLAMPTWSLGLVDAVEELLAS